MKNVYNHFFDKLCIYIYNLNTYIFYIIYPLSLDNTKVISNIYIITVKKILNFNSTYFYFYQL